ncbi:CsbD family protein [Nocardia canadensis]|uniref:CsbD family protein n=2 Tax=Nocardia TaxID=1817 RepID=UPI003743334B
MTGNDTMVADACHDHEFGGVAGSSALQARGRSAMSISKKIAYSAEATKGKIKKVFGRATGNRTLEAEGRADQIRGNLKLSGAKIKDAFKR